MKKYLLEGFFLIGLVLFVLFQTSGYSIALGLVPLLVYGFFQPQDELKNRKVSSQLLIVLLLFALRFLTLPAFDTNWVNLPHPDFHFYAKIAENINRFGVENSLTGKVAIFPAMDYAAPYRFFDAWVLAFQFAIFPLHDLTVLQLIFIPTLLSLAALAFYRNLTIEAPEWIKVGLAIAVVFIFGDWVSAQILFGHNNGELSLASYPKLAVFFCVFFYFFTAQLYAKDKAKSLVFLAALPLFIQTAFPIYLVVFCYGVYHWKTFLKQWKLSLALGLSAVFFAGFYFYNGKIGQTFFPTSLFQTVHSPAEYFKRFASIGFDYFIRKNRYFWILLGGLLVVAKANRRIVYFKVYSWVVGIFLSGIAVYAFFPNSSNSYQFLTNFVYPALISVTLLVALDRIQSLTTQTVRTSCYLSIIGFGFFGLYNQTTTYGFYNTQKEFDALNGKEFVQNAVHELQQVKHTTGLTYWSTENAKRNSFEHFDQYGTTFLLRAGAKFDVVCLSALQLKDTNFTTHVSREISALGYYNRTHPKHNQAQNTEAFFASYPFEFVFSDLTSQQLPSYIQQLVRRELVDPVSGVHLYFLQQKR